MNHIEGNLASTDAGAVEIGLRIEELSQPLESQHSPLADVLKVGSAVEMADVLVSNNQLLDQILGN